MARSCDLTSKGRLIGHKVSHSNIKTKKVSEANLKMKKVYDPETGKTIRLRIATSTMRTLDKVGGLSKFIKKNMKKYL